MVLTFANGGTPAGNNPYTGVTVTNGLGILTQIQTTLTTAGWTTQSGSPAAPPMTMRGTLGSDFCYIQFDILNSDTRLEIRGDLDGTGTTLSEADRTVHDYSNGSNNALFVTADAHAGAICIVPFIGQTEILHFGFCDRIYSTDATCIYVGKAFTAVANGAITTIPNDYTTGYQSCYVHTYQHTSANWVRIGEQWSNSSTSDAISSTSVTEPMSTIMNVTSQGYGSGSVSFNSTTATNNKYFAHLGSNNGVDNLPVLNTYYYMEGRSLNNYGSLGSGVGMHPQQYIRGTIPFIVTGLSHLASGSQWNGSSGNVYITGELGFQGMRIA